MMCQMGLDNWLSLTDSPNMGLGIEKDRNYGRIEAKSAQAVLKFSIFGIIEL